MISVIIPTFNRAKTLKRAIDSVLEQSYKDIELLIIDDCSTDNSEKIVNSYNDKRLKYIKLETNSGACYARNVGIEKSNGEYIAFQDSDDYWHKDKLKIQLENMKNNNTDIDFCAINIIDGSNIYIKPEKKIIKLINKIGVFNTLAYESFISTQSIIAKKDCFESIRFDNKLPRLQDYDLILRLLGKYKVSFTNEVLVDLYVQNDSISKNPQKLFAAIEIMLKKDYGFDRKNGRLFCSKLYKDMADNYRLINKDESIFNYKKSLKYNFNLKTLLKLVLVKINN